MVREDGTGHLEHRWWQRVAGIAQIIAAVFAAYTIWQAQKTIKMAEEERRASARPIWSFVPTSWSVGLPPEYEDCYMGMLHFRNVGLGPGFENRVSIEDLSENGAVEMKFAESWFRTVGPREELYFELAWHKETVVDAVITIQSKTGLREVVSQQRFRVTITLPQMTGEGFGGWFLAKWGQE